MTRTAALAAVLIGALAAPGLGAAEGDPARGKEIYRTCTQCHEVGPNARHRIGPHLNDLFGRAAGSLDGYRFSAGMAEAGSEGLAWDAETLDRFIADPRSVVRRTKMSFRGISAQADRADLIAYLATHHEEAVAPRGVETAALGSDLAGPTEQATEIGASAMALEGDVAYGEYLANECVTCHQPTGSFDGIPSIVGWYNHDFIRALFEYKVNIRTNPVMKNVVANLGDEEIAALAAYFETLGQ